MSLREQFPSLYNLSLDKDNNIWDLSIPINRPDALRFLLNQFQFIEHTVTVNERYECCAAIRQEILEHKSLADNDLERHCCDVLNMYACVPAISHALSIQQLGDAYDWIAFSLSDLTEIDVQQEIERTRPLSAFVLAINFDIPAINSVLLELFRCYYYYARVQNVLFEVCIGIFPVAIKLLEYFHQMGEVDIIVSCLLALGGWAAIFHTDIVDDLVWMIEDLYSDDRLDIGKRTLIGVALCTKLGNWSSKACSDWAIELLDNYRDRLSEHEKCQVLCASMTSTEHARQLHQELLRAAELHYKYINTNRKNACEITYSLSRLFDVLNPAIAIYCRNNDSGYLTELLCAWYGVADKERRKDLLYVCCDDQVTLWFSQNENIALPRELPLDDALSNVIRSMNAFLGTTNTVQDEQDFTLQAPVRPGFPIEENAQHFVECVNTMYGLMDLSLREFGFKNAGAIVLMPYMRIPFQSAMLNSAGWTLPISSSLTCPLEDSKLANVLLWDGETNLSQIELIAVKGIFETNNINVEVVEPKNRTRQRFIEAYSSTNYDAIWVAAHTEYNQYSPHLSFIKINYKDERVTIGDLEKINISGPRRRLLILNVCDGGTGAMLGGVLGLGVAQSLAQHSQAVISHIWPVDQRISPVFGALLAQEMSKDKVGYFEAFKRAVVLVNSDKQQIIKALQEATPIFNDVIERIEKREFNPEEPYFWGSPVFYE
jgi:hypothetical protein